MRVSELKRQLREKANIKHNKDSIDPTVMANNINQLKYDIKAENELFSQHSNPNSSQIEI